MKSKFSLSLSAILFVAVLLSLGGCSRVAPTLAPPIPSQVIWSNGSYGTWLSHAVTFGCGPCNTSGSVVAVTDPISGDTSTLELASSTSSGFYYFQDAPPTAVSPFVYYPAGHLQFDILLWQPPANITSIYLQYVNNSGTGNCGGYSFPVSLVNSFSTSSFTHVSIPFTSFTATASGCNGYDQSAVDTPFQLTWSVSSGGTTVTIDNVLWSAN